MKLSPREAQVVELVGGAGHQYATAAHILGISIHTLRTYVYRIAARSDIARSPREVMLIIHQRVARDGDSAAGD